MLHLLIVNYTGSEEEAAPFVRDHVGYLERHHADGLFLVSGQTVPSSQGGAIVACGVDRETVERISAEDPFVVNGVATYSITTIEPGRIHPALAELLSAQTASPGPRWSRPGEAAGH
ncbi:YciI family protein [Microbispora catharanthi]|uniref:YCII-related domain-containing protein n=1 Tax=Microbispora catharanthi TaxID=1712871 RepID=A0A5N6BA07_9ACTN|nr:YciI family protein [Microbispora catharanthi]KAB8177305.1 hypothetical protein FH610_037745 [Microbispora catharanthi]